MTDPSEFADRLRTLTTEVSQIQDVKDGAITAMQGLLDIVKTHWTILPAPVKTAVLTAESNLMRLGDAIVENTRAEQ